VLPTPTAYIDPDHEVTVNDWARFILR